MKKTDGIELDLIVQFVRETFVYDAELGELRWIKAGRGRKLGGIAGCERSKKRGYRSVNIYGRNYLLHRLIWIYCKGVVPTYGLDHKDNNARNNHIENLRDIRHAANAANKTRATTHNKYSGVVGVSKCGKTGNWRARLEVAGHLKSFGTHLTIEAAHAAYMAAKRVHFPELFD